MKAINADNVVSNKFLFYSKETNELLNVSKIILDAHGSIDKIIATQHGITAEYNSADFVYTNLILEIPGLGTALCGDRILLKHPRKKLEEFTLEFGWHTNMSNQKIYSWYLIPEVIDLDIHELPKAKTLYYDDLCNIVGTSKRLSCCLPTDVEQKITGNEDWDF